tara:strand:- start:443 stop:871 length:429 start_codon:yes stop_codon:yes gene_type:complete
MAIDVSQMSVLGIFNHISELPPKKRVGAIKAIANLLPYFKDILKYNFTDIKLDLPEGKPPYTQHEELRDTNSNRIPAEWRKMQYFLPGNNLPIVKREKLFIDILESLSPEEAELILKIKDKKLKVKNINKKIVQEALPELFA